MPDTQLSDPPWLKGLSTHDRSVWLLAKKAVEWDLLDRDLFNTRLRISPEQQADLERQTELLRALASRQIKTQDQLRYVRDGMPLDWVIAFAAANPQPED